MDRIGMRKYTVYCHVTPSNKRYIGITSTKLENRWNNGNGYKNNYHFYRAIKKYGWNNIEHKILYENLTEDEAKKKEAELISKYRLTDRRFGYNLREGGNGSFSEESRQKMSKSRMGNTNSLGNRLSDVTKKRISESLKNYYSTHNGTFKGRHHSEATIQKLKGRKMSEETRKKMRENHADVSGKNNPSARSVVQMTTRGEVVKVYDYASKAAEELSLDLSSIIKVCRGRGVTCGGYVWKYYSPETYGWEAIT